MTSTQSNVHEPRAQSPLGFMAAGKQRTADAYALREQMIEEAACLANKRTPARRVEDVLAQVQDKTSRAALTSYHKNARLNARTAETAGNGAQLALALLQSYVAGGAGAARAMGTWLALTGPLDMLVGYSRRLDVPDTTADAAGLVRAGNCSPFSLLCGTIISIAAPIGAAVGGAIGAAQAAAQGADKATWAKAMKDGAARGSFSNSALAAVALNGVMTWAQISAQLLVLVLKSSVALAGAIIGVALGSPFGLVRLARMQLSKMQAARTEAKVPKMPSETLQASQSVQSFKSARSTFSPAPSARVPTGGQ